MSFTNDTIERYIARLAAKDVTKNEIKRRLGSVDKYLKWAYGKGYVGESDFEQMREAIAKAVNGMKLGSLPVSHPIQTPSKELTLDARHYVGFAVLFVLLAFLGAGLYNQIFKKATTPFAYTTPLSSGKRVISFQGRLTDSIGNPIIAPIDITYNFYTTSTGGTPIIGSTRVCTASPDQDGVFNSLIGSDPGPSCTPELPSSIFTDNTQVWLGVKVGSEINEMSPRQQIANVGYAINAETLQGLSPGTTAGSIPFISSAGDMLIASDNPALRSTYASANFTISSAKTTTIQSANGGDIVLSATDGGTLRFNTFDGTLNERMTITPQGNIGINNVNPRAALDMIGSASLSGNLVFNGLTTQIAQLNGGNINFSTSVGGDIGLANKMTLTNLGNLGIGTTLPGYKLDVQGWASASGNLTAGGQVQLGRFGTDPTAIGAGSLYFNTTTNSVLVYNGSNWVAIGTGTGGSGGSYWVRALDGVLVPEITQDSLNLGAQATASATVHLAGKPGDNSFINTGNFGIGTTNPSSFALQVNGSVGPQTTSTFDLGSSALRWNNLYVNNIIGAASGTQGYWQRLANTVSPANITDDILSGATATASAIVRLPGTTNQNAFLNLGTGNFGIGTTAPIAKLDVQGSATIAGNLTIAQGSALRSSYGPLTLSYKSAPNNWLPAMTIQDGTGNIGIGTTAPGNLMQVTGGSSVTSLNTSGYVLNGVANSNLLFSLEANSYDRAALIGAAGNGGGTLKGDPLGREYGSAGVTGFSYDTNTGGRTPIGVYGYALQNNASLANSNNKPAGGVFISEIQGGATTAYSGPMYGVYGLANAGTVTAQAGASATGVYGNATGVANMTTYGGYFTASGGTTNYGIYSAAGTNYLSGNVGIGSTAPIEKLDVAGNATIGGNLTIAQGSSIKSAYGPLTLAYKSLLNNWSPGIILQDTTGNVGIGTSPTLSKLQVAGGNILVDSTYGLDLTGAGTLNLGNTTATTVNMGNTAATTIGIGAGGSLTRTINIGTGTGVDTIHIGDGGTGADVITIGSANAGNVTVRSNAVLNLTGSTNSLIDFPNFDVATTGNVTVAAGQGIDTNAAGILALGNTTATTVNVGNTAATTIGIGAGGSLTRTINIGTGTGGDTIHIGDGATGSDSITLGNTVAGTTTLLQGGTASAINFPAFQVAATTGQITSTYANAAALNLTGNAAGITFGGTGGNTNSITTSNNNHLYVNTGTGNLGVGVASPTSFKLQVAGDAGPDADLTYNLGSPSLRWNNLYINNIIGAAAGIQGYWQRLAQAVSPTNITDDVLTGATATASALIRLPGTNNQNAYFNLGTGNVGIGTTNPSAGRLQVAGGNVTVDSTYGIDTSAAAGTLALGGANATTVNVGNTAATTIGIGAGGSLARAISIGTGTGIDTIHIGDGGTGADVITMGSANAGNVTVQSGAVLNLTGSTNSLIDFPNFDVATTGNVTVAGGQGIDTNAAGILALGNTTATTVNIGNTAATTLALGAGGSLARTINIGTGTGIDTIHIGDGATGADVITIGSANAGNVTVRSNAVLNLTGSTNSLIDFPNFDVATTGNVTVAAGQGIDTNAAGILALGNTTATTVNIGNTAATTIGIGAGGSLARAISIGTGTGADTIHIGDGGTGADTITLGNTVAGTTLTLQGGTASTINFPAFQVAATTGQITSTYANAAALNLTGTGSGITFAGATTNQIVTASGTHLALMPGGTGNVGIGSTTPGEKLDVAGNATISGNLTISSGNMLRSGSGPLVLGYKNSLTTWAPGVSVMDGTGNVGIGTTAAAAFKLQVAGDVGPSADLTYNLGSSNFRWNNLYVNNIFGATLGVQGYWQRNGQAIAPTSTSDDILVGNTATASALVRLPGTINQSAFFNLGTGNLGIGTTSPQAKLDVNGSASLSAQLSFQSGAANYINLLGGQPLSFRTSPGGDAGLAGNERLTILGNGNIGIGTTNPTAAKLQVAGGNVTVDSTYGLDTSAAGILALGNTTATTVNLGNTAATTIAIGAGGSLARTINIGTGTGVDTIHIGDAASGADVISIGNTNAGNVSLQSGSVLTLFGGTSSVIDFPAFDVTSNGQIVSTFANAAALNLTGNAAGITFGGAAGNTNNITTSNNNNLYINTGTGNVGIGSSTPTSFKLEVAGNIGPDADNTRNIGSPSRYYNTIYANNIIGAGGMGYWARGTGVLYPVTTTDGLAATSSATTVATFTATGTNSALQAGGTANFAKIDASGNLAFTNSGTATITGPATGLTIDATTGALGFGTSNNNRTVNIGTGTGIDTIHIGDGATGADVITMGSANAGNVTVRSGAALNLTGSTNSLIDFPNFDVATTGNVTVAAGQGIDTNAAGILALGNTTATTVNVGNTAATAIGIGAGGSLARAIDIGTGTGIDTINIGTGGTGADVINIGSANAGNVTVRSNAVLNLTGSTNSLIDFPNFDVATTGNVTVAAGQGIDTNAAGILNLGNTTATTVNMGNTAATTIGIGAGGSLTRTINIGTGTGVDTIHIGDGGTGADVITIGSANAGNVTVRSNAVLNLTGSTNSLIDFPNFDVATTGNVTVAAGQGIDTNAAGILALGNTTATTVNVGNTAATTLSLGAGGSLTRTINIGTGTGVDTIHIGDGGTGADVITLGSSNAGNVSLASGATLSLTGTTNVNTTGTAATTIGNSTGILTLASGGASGWTNTGGNLTLSTATSGNILLSPFGNVGIGTTNPSSFKLQLAGDAGPNADLTYNLGSPSLRWNNLYVGNIIPGVSGVQGYWQRSPLQAMSPTNITDDVLVGGTATASALVRLPGTLNQDAYFWLGTGNLGIGTTSPIAKLDVNGSATISGNLTLSRNYAIQPAYGPLSLNYKSGLDSWATGIYLQDTTGNVGIGTTLPVQKFQVNGSSYFNGNVGIGTATPVAALDVSGAATVSGNLMTGGQFQMGRFASAPTPSLGAGSIYYNTTDNNIYYFNGTVWTAIASGGGYWTRAGGVLSPTSANDVLSITSNVSPVAQFIASGANNSLQTGGASNYMTVDQNGNISFTNSSTATITGPSAGLTIDATTGTLGFGTSANNRTINIGTGVGIDTINIGTGATGADVLTFGSANAGNVSLLSGATISLTGTTSVTGTTTINTTGTAATSIGNTTGVLTLVSGGASGWTNTSGNLTLATATSGHIVLSPAGTSNVGIGTTSPAAPLNVFDTTNPQLRLSYSTTAYGTLGVDTNSNLAITTPNAAGSGLSLISGKNTGGTTAEAITLKTNQTIGVADELLQISNNATNILTVLGSGNVGIGSISPAAPLDVTSTLAATGTGSSANINTTDNTTNALGSVSRGALQANYSKTGSGNISSWNTYAANFNSNINAGTTATHWGVWSRQSVNGGTATSLTDFTADSQYGTTGTVGSRFGFLVNDFNKGASQTLSNQYGVYVSSLTSGTTNYAVYTAGTTPSYFGGNVGIGSTAPMANLDISGTASVSSFLTLGNGTALRSAYGPLRFDYKSAWDTWTPAMYIQDGSGNVGIGSVNPQAKLDVTGGINLSTNLTAGGTASISGNLTIGYNSAIQPAYGPLTFNFKSGPNAWTAGMTLEDIWGTVGIGTTAPANRLSVSSSGVPYTGKALVGLNQLENQDIFTASSSGTPRFTIQNGGNVGINTTSTGYTLDIFRAASSNSSLGLRDGDLTHTLTGIQGDTVPSFNSYGMMTSYGASNGGLVISGIASSNAVAGLTLRGVTGGTAGTAPAIDLVGYRVGNPNALALASTDLLFRVMNYGDSTSALTMLANGNVGLGVANPGAKLDVNGDVRGSRFVSYTNPNWYVEPADVSKIVGIQLQGDPTDPFTPAYMSFYSTGSSSKVASISANFTTGTIAIDNGLTSIGDPSYPSVPDLCIGDPYWCTGKVDAGTIDPPYTINGKKYATYLSSMTGVKEETTGTVEIASTNRIGDGYATVLDFTNAPEGSDLWLFSKTASLKEHINKMSVLLTPADNARTWYKLDQAKMALIIYSSRPTTISYRLTAPRFDDYVWTNTRPDSASGGFVVNDPDVITDPYALSATGSILDEYQTQITGTLTDSSASSLRSLSYQLVARTTGEIYQDAALYSKALFGSITAGYLEAQNAVVTGIANIQTLVAGQITAATGRFTELTASVLHIEQKIISPVIETAQLKVTDTADIGTLKTDTVSPKGTSLTVNLNNNAGANSFANFIIKGIDDRAVATIDAQGNATFSGSLTAAALIGNELSAGAATVSGGLTANEASISGTLVARTIQSDTIDALNSSVASQSSSIDSLASNVNSIQQDLANIKNAPLPNPSYYQILDNSTVATFSSLLAGTVQTDSLLATGTVNMYKAYVADSLTAGNILVQGNEIMGLASELRLTALAQITLFDGSVTIAKNGNITTTGEVIAEAGVKTDNISATAPDKDINIELNSKNPVTGTDNTSVNIVNEKGEIAASIDASGSAHFNSIAFNKIATDSAVIADSGQRTADNQVIPAMETNAAAAGTGILPALAPEIIIYNSNVKPDSLIYLTPQGDAGSSQLTVVRKSATGQPYFAVSGGNAPHGEVKFNWLIIN